MINLMPFLIPIFAIVLGLSIPIIAIITEYFNKKNKLRVIEKAIEKGLPLDGLSLEEKKKPRLPYRSGMVCLALGLAGIPGFFIGLTPENKALSLCIGLTLALLGIALIINDKINYDKYFKKEP
jgi:hypothetical protein